MAFPQDNTVLAVTTPLGADTFLLVRFHGEERLSGLFRFDLDLVSSEKSVDFKSILGKGVTVKMRLPDGKARIFHGIVGRFVQAGGVAKHTSYRAELHPWLWLLTKTRDHRIFQNKSVPEIIEQVFSDLGFSDFQKKLTGTYQKREYCVQYLETAFAFVSRLMEEEGIYYYFEHAEGKHTLILGDDASGYTASPDLEQARWVGDRSSSADPYAVVECNFEKEVVVGGFATSDYNFEMPDTSLLATADGGSADGTNSKLKPYEYPGDYAQKSDGEGRAKIRIEEEEALGTRLTGRSFVRALSAGHTFKLADHTADAVNGDYVVRAVTHFATGEEYDNTFEALPKTAIFRPPRVTPKPIIAGAQTALVVGKSGEEIWTDKYGRIKVQFFWDREGKKDENSSCWVRVAQGWAGQGWGAIFLPRVGQEVVVSFLGGDPDRPLVTGSVYNATQTVPYALPDEQTKSTLQSRSSKQGSAGNEIRFEDKKDSEELYVHAQKDMVYKVENDWKTEVLHDQTTTITNARTTTVKEADDKLTVEKGNRTVEVQKGDETHSVKGKRSVTVEGDETHTDKANFDQKVSGNFTLKVDGNITIEASGSVTIKSGTAMSIKSGTDYAAEAGTSMSNKAQMNIQNQAQMNIENKAQMNLTAEAGLQLNLKASAMGTLDGGGMLTVKGGMVKIN
jgi:type VI secretion system secreted protein VgrG